MLNSKKIIYVDGVFDLLHIGHLNLLKEAKKLGNYLLVGVVLDEDAESYKRKPIIPYNERELLINSLQCVDKTIPAVLHITEQFIKENSINLVIHGDDDEQVEFFKVPREMGIMKYIPYYKETNTTDIIKRITYGQSLKYNL